MYRSFGITNFFALAILVCSVYGQADNRINATWQVQKYDISAALPQTETDRNVAVRAKLDLKNVSTGPATTLTLRISQAAEISAVRVGETAVEFTKGEEKAGSATLQKFAVRLPSVAQNGLVSVFVDYKLNIKDNSGLASMSPGSAQFLPLSFWYPTPNSWYFARGADYAPFRVSVTGQSITAVSGGKAQAIGSFDQKLKGQPFFAAGNWDVATAAGVDIYLPKSSNPNAQVRAAEIAGLAAEARAFLAGMFGAAPDVPLKIVAVKRGAGFAGGGTLFIDESVFRRSKIDSQTALSIADGIAKTWLGGSASIAGDGEGAIREGLSRYAATQFIEAKFGQDVADVERERQRNAYAGVVSRDAPITVVAPLDDYYYAEVANKGAMIWRLLARKSGGAEFVSNIKSALDDGIISLSEVRGIFAAQKEFLDYGFDQITDMNLQAGLPLQVNGEARSALRNTGSIDATVTVVARLSNGERLPAQSTVRARSFGEVVFKTTGKIARIEIDSEKLYPQTDYSDDVAPRAFTESDSLLAVKRLFDKQEFANAELAAVSVLSERPRFDDVRVFLGRSLLAQGKTALAEREFRSVLDEKLPTSRSLAWANVGLAELASRSGQTGQAAKFAGDAIRAEAEYGSSLAARSIRSKLNLPAKADDDIVAFFAAFDRSAAANRKSDLAAMILPGEVSKFASGIAGQTEQWKTQIVQVDQIDSNTVLVETVLTIKLLNREIESGTAVYRVSKTASGWKLSGVEIFEVR